MLKANNTNSIILNVFVLTVPFAKAVNSVIEPRLFPDQVPVGGVYILVPDPETISIPMTLAKAPLALSNLRPLDNCQTSVPLTTLSG